MLNVEKKNF